MKRHHVTTRAVPLTLAFVAACGSIEPEDLRETPKGEWDPTTPADQPLAVTVGPEGVVLGHAGLKMEIPAGALDGDVEITVTPSGTPPGSYEAASALYDFGPDGLVFAEPVTVTFIADRADPDLRVYWSTPVGGWAQLADSSVDGTSVSGTITHFSTGFTSLPGPETEIFTAPDASLLDVLFVVDDSGSMIEEQAALVAHFPLLLDAVMATTLDWHVGVVTTDMDAATRAGALTSAGGARWVDGATVDPAALFTQLASVGTSGNQLERGLAAAQAAVDMPTAAVQAANTGFFRAGSQLAFLILSDEDDASEASPTVAGFVSWAQGLRADPDDIHTHMIVGPIPSGCDVRRGVSADPGFRYHDVALALGGTTSSICDADWTAGVEAMLGQVRATECQALLQPADPTTVEVFLHPSGTVLPAGAWGYDEDDACVFLTPLGYQQAGGSDIGVTYYPPGAGGTGHTGTP